MKVNRVSLLSILSLLLLPFFLMGQSEAKLKRAKERFDKKAYASAITTYEELVENGYTSEEALKRLGDSYYYNANYTSASEWYGKLVQLEDLEVEQEYVYRYAQTLKSLGDYEGSDKWMMKFESGKKGDGRAEKFMNKKNYLEEIKNNSGRYAIENVSFNSGASDFAPSFYGGTVVFSSARDTGKVVERIHSWNNKAFLNLYETRKGESGLFSEPERLSAILNKKTHESSAVFTKDGKTVYFTRNNSKDGKFERDNEGVSRLKLFESNLVDGEWQKPIELPFNSDDYSVAHPALGNDEKTLYFSSDMPGTTGQSDIFKVSINADGSFGSPENLGKTVNTEARESFPFVINDILYFSSDGHPGLGGLDVFASKIDGSSEEVINLGEPLNGRQDDFSYIINTEGQGFFASNREGGKGGDDIYSFIENEPLQFECISNLTGIVKDRETDNPLSSADIMVMNGEQIIAETKAAADGTFSLDVDCNKEDYSLVASKQGYLSHSESFIVESGQSTEVVLALPKAKMPAAVAGTDLIKHLQLAPIYFDLDESNIRSDAQQTLNQIVAYLNEYPEVKISIESHTDAKASKSYNQRLSQRRAKSTLDYLIANGIDASRMESNGFGEQNLINNCTVWENCSPDENEQNRRSEIIVKN